MTSKVEEIVHKTAVGGLGWFVGFITKEDKYLCGVLMEHISQKGIKGKLKEIFTFVSLVL